MKEKRNACCFIGHRKIDADDELKKSLYKIIENLIVSEGVTTFLFGSKSEFDSLCYKVIKELKQKYNEIKRVYVRSAYSYINDFYEEFLLELYEETYFPKGAENAGKAIYVERNYEMIDKSDYCIFYYKENYLPPMRKRNRPSPISYQPRSGTQVAYEYAVRKKKTIINVAN